MAKQTKLSGQTPEDLAAVLTKAYGSPVEPGMIEADIQSGAPVNRDGSVSLVAYVAWMIKQEHDGRTRL